MASSNSAESLILPAFLASFTSSSQLQAAVLSNCSNLPECTAFGTYLHYWSELYLCAAPESPASFKQSAWDRPGIIQDKMAVWNSSVDPVFQCRLAAVSAAHSGDWLHGLPIAACGLKLDDEAIHVAVGLRLGVNLCTPHLCPCGLLVDATGSHSFSCK
jgi:hypothetical protein